MRIQFNLQRIRHFKSLFLKKKSIAVPLKDACEVISVMSNSATPWNRACQAPPSTGFSRQEYWSGLPCPPPGDLPDPGIQPMSQVSCTGCWGFLPLAPPGKPNRHY